MLLIVLFSGLWWCPNIHVFGGCVWRICCSSCCVRLGWIFFAVVMGCYVWYDCLWCVVGYDYLGFWVLLGVVF